MNLKDKIVVITGAASGLGRALAKEFKKREAKLVLGDCNKSELEKVAAFLAAFEVLVDVRDEKQVQNLASKAIEKFGRIDIWINNAGIWVPHSPVLEQDIKKLREMIEVNFFGLVYGSREALKAMENRGGGIIVQIISIRALDPRPNETGYVASKFAADGFTKSLRLELKPKNILVIAVYPAGIQTNLFGNNLPESYSNYMKSEYVADLIVKNLEKDVPKEELIIEN